MTESPSDSRRRSRLAAWISPRHKRFWVIVLIVAYTVFGFLVAPWIAREQIVARLGDLLQRPVALREVRINPYALSIEAADFRVDERDGAALLGFSRLYANLQLSSLFRRALVFRDIELDTPHLNVVRDEDASINLVTLLASPAGDAPPADDTDTPALPPFIVERLALTAGIVDVADRSLATDFTTRLGPVDINVSHLSTLPDDAGEQQVSVASEESARFGWSGSVQMTPLLSEGRVTVTGRYLPLLYRYFQDQLNFSVGGGEIDVEFAYRVALPPDGVLSASIDGLSGTLTGITARADDRDAEFLSLPETRLAGGYLHWPERRAGADSLEFHGPAVQVWRDAGGTLMFERLLAARPDAAPGPEPQAAGQGESAAPEVAADDATAAPWELRLGALRIIDLSVGFTDEALREPGRLDVPDVDFAIEGLSNAADAEFPLTAAVDLRDHGRIDADGTLAVLPELQLRAGVAVADLALPLAQPWIAHFAQVALNAGLLGSRLDVAVGPGDELALAGTASVARLDVDDARRGERLIGWDDLAFDRFEFTGRELEVSEIALARPYVRLLITEDGTTNFGGLARGDGEAAADESAPAEDRSDGEAPFALTVGRVRVTDGQVDFTDRALPLPFDAQVRELVGGVSALGTGSREPAMIELEGKVDEFGFARIAGSLLPSDPTADTDINVLFRNVELPDLSPYTIKFAGRRIDKGRLEVELDYRIAGGELEARNDIVIDRIALGDKVAHPGAMDLPLGLAVALLQDPSGRIDIDLPVRGNVNDPEFSIRGVVLRTFANLITKAVTSPFRLLGGLVGANAENFDRIEFEPGQSDLTPPEREKLGQLASALAMRPALQLSVSGAVDPARDAAALRTARVDARVDGLLEADAANTDMIAARRRDAIETLYRDAFPDVRLRDIRPDFEVPVDPARPEGATTFDELAYVARLRERLIDAEPVGAADLDALATARAAAVVQHLTAAAQPVEPDRVARGATVEVEATERGFVPLKLALGK